MNQDGAGAGFASIINSNPNTGTTNSLNINLGINGGALVLADDLLVSNTGGSTAANGAISFGATLVVSGTGSSAA